jgi:hypothetical protein
MHEKDDRTVVTAIAGSAPRSAGVGCPYCQHASGDRDIFPSVLRHLRLNAPQHAGDPTWVP